MDAEHRSTTRKGCTPIKVYCLPEERAEIEGLARASGHSTSTYLRLVGQGYRVQSILDYEHVQEMAKVNGDLGRLGGLLKLWLTDDAKLATYDAVRIHRTIIAALDEIRANQTTLREVMAKIVMPLAAKNLGSEILAAKKSVPEIQP